ncbi:MAG: hypothetical protein H0U77_05080, partial [Nocardioidaceae bacterium]|nr:hypothetical protein [Nocardioidaceae bacterium]
GGIALVAVRLAPAQPIARPWVDGASLVACLAAFGTLIALGLLGLAAARTVVDVATPVWGTTGGAGLDPYQALGQPAAWTLPVLVVALAVVVALLVGLDPWVPAGLAAAAGGAGLPLLYPAPLGVAVGLAAGFGALLLAAATLRQVRGANALGWLLLGSAAAPALGSTGVTAAWATAAAAVAGVLVVARGRGARAPLAAILVLAGSLAVFGWVSLGPASLAVRGLVLALLATAVLGGVQQVARYVEGVRLGVETGAVVVAAAGLGLLAVEGSLGKLALALTALGAAVSLAALLVRDRRPLAPAGGLLLASATWVRLADTGVDVVEAYTLPSALVLVAAGVWWLREESQTGTTPALLPGLGLAIGPSLLLALEDPVGLRGLLVGIGALALVLVGVRLHWDAPLVVGGVALAVLAVRELGPVAVAVPRWTLFALAGALLLTVGVTWERRSRELIAAARYVAALR